MWDQRYSEPGFAYGTIANDFLRAHSHEIRKGGKVLCLAEGEGRNAVFLAEQGYQVTAVDQSQIGLQKAAQLAKERHVSIATHVCSLEEFDFGAEQWDGIVSIFAHVPPTLRQQIHQRLAPALKKGGVFLLEAYTLKQLEMDGKGGPPCSQKELLMSLADLQQELGKLSLLLGHEIQRHISEGKYHQGHSAVVQILARKD